MVILFDMDGTVIDSTEAILEGFCVAFEQFEKYSATEEDIKALIGYPLDIMFARLGVEEAYVEAHVNAYKQHYRKISTQKTVLLERAEESILLAKEFARLGVVTTKTGKYTEELLEHFGLLEYFEVVIGREHVKNPKPHEEPILKALDKMQVSANTSVYMIGDTLLDVHAAQNANVACIAVSCGYEKRENLEQESKIVKDSCYSAVEYLHTVEKNSTKNSNL